MSTRKRPLAEIPQGKASSSGNIPATPNFSKHGAFQSTIKSRQSTDGYGATHLRRPGSARNILRRLARVTATTTQPRIATPNSAITNKENTAPVNIDGDVKDEIRKPVSGFDIEESIEEEDDSGLPVAPTPSALLEVSDEEDLEQPTITFFDVSQAKSAASREQQTRPAEHSLLYSDPELPIDDETHYESTFLSERGRRAVSEDRTRMSRYSFGSIRMSDFGTELEIRRESDRQQKLADLEAEDDYGAEAVDIQLGGETEILRGLQPASPPIVDGFPEVDEGLEGIPFDIGFDQHEELQTGDDSVEGSAIVATQAGDLLERPQIADTVLEPDEEAAIDQTEPDQQNGTESRRHTLLEAMISTAAEKKRPKKMKMNQHGNMVPGLPSSLMKRIIHSSQEKANKRKTAFGKDHIKALEQATEWFFEQASQDLDAYSRHGRRKKRIDADDVLLLMRRQRVLKGRRELQKLAKDWLPREILNELDLPEDL